MMTHMKEEEAQALLSRGRREVVPLPEPVDGPSRLSLVGWLRLT